MRKILTAVACLLVALTSARAQSNPKPTPEQGRPPATQSDSPFEFETIPVAEQSKVIVWSRDDLRCYVFILEGRAIRGCKNDDDVYVSTLWAESSGKFTEHDIMVTNSSSRVFTFLVDDVSLIFDEKTAAVEVRPSDPEKIARDLMKRGRWGSFLGAFGAGMATRTTTVTDSQGNISTVQQPDYAAQARARAANAEVRARNAEAAGGITNRALRSNTLFLGRSIIGATYFRIPKKFQSLDRLVVIAAGTRFEFPFPKAEEKTKPSK